MDDSLFDQTMQSEVGSSIDRCPLRQSEAEVSHGIESNNNSIIYGSSNIRNQQKHKSKPMKDSGRQPASSEQNTDKMIKVSNQQMDKALTGHIDLTENPIASRGGERGTGKSVPKN